MVRRLDDALYLSPRAILRHTANLYQKIGVQNKVEATAWTLSHPLARVAFQSGGGLLMDAAHELPDRFMAHAIRHGQFTQ